jgi:hypothetical protein
MQMATDNRGKPWSKEELNYLAYELRRRTPLLDVAKQMNRDVVEVEIMGDRIALPDLPSN